MVNVTVEGKVLVLRVNLEENHGGSKSGKTQIIASSQGNVAVPVAEYAAVKFGLNVYR
ncbi:MAG TPA: hypothetical protein VJA25_02535 [Dehalococcoidia bacterium]|nr:hypothetical protein [Dehalococcoidia bacterium]